MALSAGAKKILMAAAAKKAARKTLVKVARPFMAPVLAAQAPAVKKTLAKEVKTAIKVPTKVPALMPCRFCKRNTGNIQDGIPSLGYWVRCLNKDCLCSGPRKDNIIAAVAAWNN